MVFPVLPGKREALRSLLKALAGPRFAEYDAASRRWGFERDTWFLQTTPQGVLIIYYGEGADIPGAWRDWATCHDPFDLWFKEQLKDITGIDYNDRSNFAGPWPEQIHKYRFDDR
jgi:hypothetical protein